MPFDLFCAGVIGFFALWGLFRGLLRQIFGIAGFVGGIVLARMFAGPFGDAFAKDLQIPAAVAAVALSIAIFISVEVIAKLVGGALHKSLAGGFTGAVDRVGGLAVGAGKGLLIAWAVASALVLLRPHLGHVERDTPASRLDLSHSQAIAAAASTNLITELRRQ